MSERSGGNVTSMAAYLQGRAAKVDKRIREGPIITPEGVMIPRAQINAARRPVLRVVPPPVEKSWQEHHLPDDHPED